MVAKKVGVTNAEGYSLSRKPNRTKKHLQLPREFFFSSRNIVRKVSTGSTSVQLLRFRAERKSAPLSTLEAEDQFLRDFYISPTLREVCFKLIFSYAKICIFY